VPTLLDLQRALRRSVFERDHRAIAASLSDPAMAERLDIYRNTFMVVLTKALKLCYPAVARLVGGEFFEGAAQLFIAEHPPRTACLDHYGDAFPDFLRDFPPAASVAYVADVARLEWAVNCALHAPDLDPLDTAQLATLAPDDQSRVSFAAHPSIRLLQSAYPVDAVWRAVLARDDAALTELDVDTGPVALLVERGATGVEVARLDDSAWRLLAALCGGHPLEAAIARAAELDVALALAGHLASGRFVAFRLPAAALPESAV
jgi:hypothetical protein